MGTAYYRAERCRNGEPGLPGTGNAYPHSIFNNIAAELELDGCDFFLQKLCRQGDSVSNCNRFGTSFSRNYFLMQNFQ
ncbi:hypothetical protein D3C86_1595150 [compost metagenome]